MKNRNIWMLFDCPNNDNDKQWLVDEVSTLSGDDSVRIVAITTVLAHLERQGALGKVKARLTMIWQAARVVVATKKEDVIITWNHHEGLYVNILLQLCRKKNRLVSMNWLSPKGYGEKLQKKQKALIENTNNVVVVNSPESERQWIETLKLGNKRIAKFIIIPDVYDTHIPFQQPKNYNLSERYCFTGGMNNRNWKLIIELAQEFSNINFVCVALKSDFDRQVEKLPQNVKTYFDVKPERYYYLLENAYLVLLPLLDDRVAGLINITRAAQAGVPCLITRTAATKQYYSKYTNELLVGKESEWKEKLQRWYSYEKEEYESRTSDFSQYIRETFSPHRAAEKIMSAVNCNLRK